MPKIPSARPADSPRCDPRLPFEALTFRRQHGLISPKHLGALNITAWLYRDPQDLAGVTQIRVNPNTTIAELAQQFGRADTPDAEVGFHSEGHAAEWFRVRPKLQVLAIFSERVPCSKMCAPMLRHYYPGVPWYYYYDMNVWRNGPRDKLLLRVAAALKTAYGL